MDDTFNVEFQGELLEAKPLTRDQIGSVQYLQSEDGALAIEIMGALIGSAIGRPAWRTMLLGQAAGTLTMKQIAQVLGAVVDGSVEYHKEQQKAQPEVAVRTETVQAMTTPPAAGVRAAEGPPPVLDNTPRTFRAGD